MKQFIYILLLTVTGIFAGCTDIDKENPYDNQLHSLQVTAVYPDGYTDHLREGVTVKIEDVDRGNSYKAKTDKNGVAQFSLTKGITIRSVTFYGSLPIRASAAITTRQKISVVTRLKGTLRMMFVS